MAAEKTPRRQEVDLAEPETKSSDFRGKLERQVDCAVCGSALQRPMWTVQRHAAGLHRGIQDSPLPGLRHPADVAPAGFRGAAATPSPISIRCSTGRWAAKRRTQAEQRIARFAAQIDRDQPAPASRQAAGCRLRRRLFHAGNAAPRLGGQRHRAAREGGGLCHATNSAWTSGAAPSTRWTGVASTTASRSSGVIEDVDDPNACCSAATSIWPMAACWWCRPTTSPPGKRGFSARTGSMSRRRAMSGIFRRTISGRLLQNNGFQAGRPAALRRGIRDRAQHREPPRQGIPLIDVGSCAAQGCRRAGSQDNAEDRPGHNGRILLPQDRRLIGRPVSSRRNPCARKSI